MPRLQGLIVNHVDAEVIQIRSPSKSRQNIPPKRPNTHVTHGV